jgi:hypothetical protein
MNYRNLSTATVGFLLLTLPKVALAEIDCDPLKPNPPRDLSTEATGKIDAKLQRFISLGGSIDGSYNEASNDVLKDYPNADRLYLWDRLIYLNCQGLRELHITDAEKFDRLNQLMDRVGHLPNDKGN